MVNYTTVALPGGLWIDGVRHRRVELRPLTGEDEAFLLDNQGLAQAAKTTAVLARCLANREDPDLAPQPAEQVVKSLTAGDREALLLNLRRLTFGPRLACVLRCPDPDCGHKMDLDLSIDELLLDPYPDASPTYEAVIGENGHQRAIVFRSPTGADLEAIAPLARSDAGAAALALQKRCLVEPAVGPSEALPEAIQEALPALLAKRDPQAELLLNLRCPVCDRPFTALYDAATYFFQEVASRSAHLYWEVHMLAFYYHWSEAEIMGMSASRRGRYLDLLTEALGEGGG